MQKLVTLCVLAICLALPLAAQSPGQSEQNTFGKAPITIDAESVRQLMVMLAHIKAAKQAMEHIKCLRSNGNDPWPCVPFEVGPLPSPIDSSVFERLGAYEQMVVLESLAVAGNELLDETLNDVIQLRDELRDSP